MNTSYCVTPNVSVNTTLYFTSESVLVLSMYSLPLPLKVFEVGNMTEYMTSQGNIAKDLAGSSSIVICMSCELKEPERLPTFSN